MMQVARDKTIAREMGERLGMVLDHYVDGPVAAVARAMGYKNASVLSRARRGQTSLSAEKLQALASLKLNSGATISLHWLLTGKGIPILPAALDDTHGFSDTLARRVHEASPRTRAQIEAFLDVVEPTAHVDAEASRRHRRHSHRIE